MHRSIQNILNRRAVLTGATAAPLTLAFPAAAAKPESPYTAAAVSQRVNDFAKMMDVPAVTIEADVDGLAILSDSLTEWCTTHGASVDWIACGDMRSMFRLVRDHYQRMQPRQDLTDAEVADLLEEIHAASGSEAFRLINELGKTNAPAVIQRALDNALAAGVSS